MSWLYLLLGLLAAGVVIHCIAKLTISIVKKYRKKNGTKVIAAQLATVAKNAVNSPTTKHVKFDELEKYDSAILEYDPFSEEIIHADFCEDVDNVVRAHQRLGGGIAVYED